MGTTTNSARKMRCIKCDKFFHTDSANRICAKCKQLNQGEKSPDGGYEVGQYMDPIKESIYDHS